MLAAMNGCEDVVHYPVDKGYDTHYTKENSKVSTKEVVLAHCA